MPVIQVNSGIASRRRTGYSTTVLPMEEKLRSTYGLTSFVLATDRGMLTRDNIRIPDSLEDVDQITALRGDTIQKLVNQNHLQSALFGERKLFEFVVQEDYPGRSSHRSCCCTRIRVLCNCCRNGKSGRGFMEAPPVRAASRRLWIFFNTNPAHCKNEKCACLNFGRIINNREPGCRQ